MDANASHLMFEAFLFLNTMKRKGAKLQSRKRHEAEHCFLFSAPSGLCVFALKNYA